MRRAPPTCRYTDELPSRRVVLGAEVSCAKVGRGVTWAGASRTSRVPAMSARPPMAAQRHRREGRAPPGTCAGCCSRRADSGIGKALCFLMRSKSSSRRCQRSQSQAEAPCRSSTLIPASWRRSRIMKRMSVGCSVPTDINHCSPGYMPAPDGKEWRPGVALVSVVLRCLLPYGNNDVLVAGIANRWQALRWSRRNGAS